MSVSVVIATYNGEKYIEEQMDSIMKQLHEDDELIICDDCSSDQTVSIIKNYIKEKDSKILIHLVVNEKNLGYQENFKKILGFAKNDFVFFSDQDDIWEDRKIEIMTSIMIEHSECKLLCCDYDIFADKEIQQKIPSYQLKKMPNNYVLEKVKLTPQSIYIGQLGCCMCLRQNFCKQIENYWFKNWAQDDRCWRLALADESLYIIHSNLVHHRIHDNNTATYGKYHTIEKRITLFKSMIAADKEMIRWINNESIDKTHKKLISKNMRMMSLRVELLEKKRIFNIFKLLKYLTYYQTKKSFFVEIYIMLKNK